MSPSPTPAPATGPAAPPTHRPIVQELQQLLHGRPDLAEALRISLRRADYQDIHTLEACFAFLDHLATLIPTDRDLSPAINEFYYLLSFSPNDHLRHDPRFSAWMVKFAADWGSFLDTHESAQHIAGFLSDPAFRMDDYFPSPSGWQTFNQFFAREVKPGRRPIHAHCDDHVIVSPADSVFMGQWTISDESTLTVKRSTLPIRELMAGSPHWERFRGGLLTHRYLDVNDYHRYHTPVAGKVLECRKIPGRVDLEVYRKPDGTLDSRDGTGYQFTQDRGLLVLDSPIGLVAILPIGMAQVSSVNLLPDKGAELRKGELFGFFLFGGSDIVMLFEAGRAVHLETAKGEHLKQGQEIGRQRP